MSTINKFSLLAITMIWISVRVQAADIKEAMVVSYSGTVEIFSELNSTGANDKSLPEKPLVIFDGHKYMSRRVQAGIKVHPNDILRSGNDGKMKVIYDNGDVFILAPATAFTIPKITGQGADAKVSSELIYGKVRGMIDKKGPISGIIIKTKTAVAGVRGTDLYVSYNPTTENTQVHVLRGDVQVEKINPTDSKNKTPEVVSVKTGQKALLDGKFQVLQSTQQELAKIQSNTTAPPTDLEKLKPEEKIQIQKLITTSQEKVLEDIKVTTPEVYKTLQLEKNKTVEAMSQAMVTDLSKSAPKGKEKPKMSDFEKDEDVYKKYFIPVK